MKYKIIVDSSGDIPEGFLADTDIGVAMAPLTITVGNESYVDDSSLDVHALLRAMKACKEASSTSCPPPEAFSREYEESDQSFAITISSKLSGTYNSALAAKMLTQSKFPDKKIHVVDSLATSGTMMLLAMKLAELIQAGRHTFDEMVERIEEYRKSLNLLFLIHTFDNLVKAGRMSRVAGTIAGALRIMPICGDDGNGQIKIFEKVRGTNQAIRRLVETIAERTAGTKDKQLIITHCNNPENAEIVRSLAEKYYEFKKIYVLPMRGLTTYYCGDKGIIISFG